MANFQLPEELYNYYRKHKLKIFHTGNKLKKGEYTIGIKNFTLNVPFKQYDYIEIKDLERDKEWFAIPSKDGGELEWL